MIAATLTGPNYYDSPNNDETSIEVFDHLGHVIDTMFERYSANGKYALAYRTLDGVHHNTRFPGFEEGTMLTCYLLHDHDNGVLTEDTVLEALSAVHGGHWDYGVELSRNEEFGGLEVIVEKNGVN